MSETESGAAAATELTLPERAQKALAFAETKTQLEALAAQSKRITEIRDPASYAECHGARMALKNKRIDIQRAGKAAREDATKFSKEVIRVEGELVAIIAAEEQRLQALQDAVDAQKEEEKRLKIEAEERRVRGHQQRIAMIRDLPFEALNDTVEGLEARLCTLATEAVGDDYEEFKSEAQQALAGTVDKLGALLQQKRDARAEADRLQAEREALERRRREDEEIRAQQERVDRARREAEERQQREAVEFRNGRLAYYGARLAEAGFDDVAKIDAVLVELDSLPDETDAQLQQHAAATVAELQKRMREAVARNERAEQDKAARAQQEQERAQAEERERLARAERDRVENEQREARRQQEESERQQREAEAVAARERLTREREELEARERALAEQRAREEAERIERESAGLELLDVARDAHALLLEEGLDNRNRTLRLGFVLNRLLPKVAGEQQP